MTQTIEPTKVQTKQIRTFSLSPSFLSEFKDKQPEWGYNGLGYIVYKRCVHIDTPVLCADLSWKPAGELKMGEQLLAFEEGSMKRGTSNKKPRHMLISTVTDNSVELAECVKITLSNGDQLICTADHSWLVRTGYGLEWVEAKDLLSRKKCEFIKYADVWKHDTSFDAGYLAGAFDGEGSLDRRRTISFTQTDNAMLSRVKDILTEKGYEFSIREKKQNKLGKKKCFSLNLYSNAQVMRFLGEIRPSRLLEKYVSTVDEMAMRRRSKHVVVSNVVSVESIGIHPIAVLSTTSKTHITAGYPSHNTYAREKPDGNLEEFWETCQRVVEGTYDIQKRHCKTLRLTWDDRKAQRSAQEMYRRMWEFKWLPPGRGLWMMGTPNVERIGSAALNNCFSGETEVLFFRDGKIGSGLLSDLVDSKLELFLENGEKVPAIIQHVGKQKVYKAVFKVPGRSKYCLSYDVTKDHRWILADGTETTELKVGDRVGVVPLNFDIDKNSQIYKRGFSHGLIFGDGTRHTYYPNRHFIRLCGEKEQKHITVLESMPEHLSTTHPQTYNNDSVVTLVFNDETNWKELPLGDEGIEYFRAFVDGWMAADSHIEGKDTICLDSSNYKACVWLAKIAPLIGYTVSGWSVETRDTNFGPRTFPLNRIKLRSRKTTMELVSFDEGEEVDVYCPLVPTHHRFMLFGGIVTGNCAFISTKGVAVDFAQPFCWMMDMLMLGLGVGFDTKGAGLVKIKKPNVTDVPFVVEDSREGWVALLRVVLDSYTGRGALPSVIDYSLVRPFGAPIKGFGGTSSGPDPLIELIKSVQDILNKIVDSELTTSAIVDICNLVGRCVVSGNVRRSAEIAFGDPNDEAFLNLKNPEINQEALNHHRWASNNSIFAEVGMDYSKVAEMTAKNGEPGYQWLENARAYSRMNGVKDFVDALAAGANPCFSGDTLVAVADGRHAVSFKQLAEEGKDVPVYSLTPDGKVEIQWGRNPRMTRESAKLVRIHLDDGSTMDVTPDHNMILRDGSIKKAADLLKGDSLPRFTKQKATVNTGGNEYAQVVTDINNANGKEGRKFEHQLIAKFFEPKKWDEIYNEASASGWIKGGLVVHHKDYNPLNNSPDNLEIMTFKDHAQYHADHDRSGENNGMFGKPHSEETKSLIGIKTSERVADPEFLEKLRASHTTEERAEASTRMKSAKEIWDKKYYLEQEKNTDLQTVWVGEQMFAKKVCEHCSSEFVVPWGKRDRLYCSAKCFNVHLQSLESRKNGQRTAFVNRQQATLHDQIMAYKDLQDSLKRDPFKKEWEQECRSRSLSFRFRSGTSSTVNPHALKSFADLQARAENYNHRVVKVEVLDGEQPVYNITVDGNHTYAVILNSNLEGTKLLTTGIFTNNCVEQTLEDGEICCLVETFPGRHESFEDYRKTLKYAYLYAKTVTLIPTHDHKTNTVVMRNRRIGCSMSGIVQAVQKFGRRKFFTDFCDAGYGYLRELDKKYSGWLCVRTSIKITSVKPSGSVSLLPGVTPGIHFPHSEFYIRRVRLQSSSPLVKVLESSGYHIEKDSYSPNTVVAEFPVHESNFDRSKDSVTLWEQLEMAAQMQQYWADNQVSVTVTFKPEEARDIKYALELYETRLKGVSFLPIEDHGYAQAPYEEITKEEYEKFMSGIRPISAETLAHEETSKFCDGESCTI